MPPNEKSATEQQIREMAKLALVSNTINPIQEKNLKMFPFVFFNGVKEAKIEYDFTNNQTIDTEEDIKTLEITYKFNKIDTRHFCVAYHLTLDQNETNAQIEKRYEALQSAVRNLFWNETRVKVSINGKLEFESKNV